MSTEEVKYVLDKLKEAGCIFLLLTGGETFLRKDLFEILDYATDQGFVVSLKTTATLMTEEAAAKIKSFGVKEVHVSILGGTAQAHDEVTAKKGSFDKMVAGVKMLLKAGVKVHAKSVITRGHIGEIYNIDKLCREEFGLPEEALTFDSMIFPKSDFNRIPIKYRLTDDELREYYRILRRNHVEKFPFVDPNEPIDDLALSCSAGINGITVAPNGDVYACMALPFPIGNILKQSAREIMDGPENDALLNNIKLSSNKDCSGCENRMGCFRCPAIAYLENGAFGKAAKENCRQTRIKKEVVYGIVS
jgi:radical SAM protein with 4Fe4S-binding SPASM domain